MNALCNALDLDDLPMPATPQVVWNTLQTGFRHNPRHKEG